MGTGMRSISVLFHLKRTQVLPLLSSYGGVLSQTSLCLVLTQKYVIFVLIRILVSLVMPPTKSRGEVNTRDV